MEAYPKILVCCVEQLGNNFQCWSVCIVLSLTDVSQWPVLFPYWSVGSAESSASELNEIKHKYLSNVLLIVLNYY